MGVFSFIAPAFAGAVEITTFGHSALLIKGGGSSVLLNPFQAVGCAQGLQEPKIRASVILASSELADEGARIAKGIFLVQPGSYRVDGMNIEGFSTPHDRLGGRRFGQATVWKWTQSGIDFAHLGGSAAPLSAEDKVLLGTPDVLIIAVGGGAKVYDGREAANVVKDLQPKRVIPVQYLSRKDAPKQCDLSNVQPFLDAMDQVEVKKVGKTFTLPKQLSNQLVINLMR